MTQQLLSKLTLALMLGILLTGCTGLTTPPTTTPPGGQAWRVRGRSTSSAQASTQLDTSRSQDWPVD